MSGNDETSLSPLQVMPVGLRGEKYIMPKLRRISSVDLDSSTNLGNEVSIGGEWVSKMES